MNTIQTKDKAHWLAHSKLSCVAAAALAFSAFQGVAQQVPSQPVKNIVLLHGAFSDGSSWAKVIPLLEAKGLHVTAVQNPLSSLADDVAATRRAIAKQDGPVILFRFIHRHQLQLIIHEASVAENPMRIMVGFPGERAAPLPIGRSRPVDFATSISFRAYGINE